MKLRARFNELHDGKLLDRVKSETKGKFESVLLACLQATPEDPEEETKPTPVVSTASARTAKRVDELRRAIEATDDDALVAVLSDVCRADGAGRRAVAQASAGWRGPF